MKQPNKMQKSWVCLLGMRYELKILVDFPPFYKGHNFCDFLFEFHYIKLRLKGGLL